MNWYCELIQPYAKIATGQLYDRLNGAACALGCMALSAGATPDTLCEYEAYRTPIVEHVSNMIIHYPQLCDLLHMTPTEQNRIICFNDETTEHQDGMDCFHYDPAHTADEVKDYICSLEWKDPA